MTDTGGEHRLVRDLPGVEDALVRALADALDALEGGFAGFCEQLEEGGVHEHAFGKLIDAAKVRDAYQDRLPATKVNLSDAGGVARSFLDEFVVPGPPCSPVPRTPAIPPQIEPEGRR